MFIQSGMKGSVTASGFQSFSDHIGLMRKASSIPLRLFNCLPHQLLVEFVHAVMMVAMIFFPFFFCCCILTRFVHQ